MIVKFWIKYFGTFVESLVARLGLVDGENTFAKKIKLGGVNSYNKNAHFII